MSLSGHKIKVVCRVRPFLKTEKPDDSVSVEANNVLRVSNPRDSTKDVKFNFDSCYGPEIDQATIYRNDVRPLVEAMFSGMSATVFCYGVTGAGKTHTIQGTDTEPGIIPRAVEHIFMHQQRDPYDYDIRIRYYEIYKEAVFDLLKPHDPTMAGLPIREDAQRKIFVAGLSEKRVTSYEQFDSIYQKASGNRRTASTKLNNHSSRSHAILTVQVQWQDDIGAGKTWCGRLHLIDLAGSEDNRRTENGKDRMAESSAINRSLFVLGQVVEALNTGSSRIPYRDSKMTRILQDSLGGESLGMMIVNVAPGEAFLQDTNNTLNFATKSRQVVNKPVAHEVVEQRWSAVDRLQHHRGALAAGRLGKSTVVVASGPGGLKRRRSDDPMDVACDSDEPLAHDGTLTSSGGLPAARRHVQATGPVARPGRHSDGSRKPGQALGGAPLPRQADFVQRAVAAKFNEMEQKTSTASNEIMERVMRIEQQLSGSARLDSSVVIDMFTPATKLKTSRGWLKHARELEQGGHLEKALAHYEEALRYAPELNKLEAHIEKLRARLRRQKRRSSIASHGAANMRVADQIPGKKPDDDDDCGPLWMIDGLAESPGAEKAKRRARGPATMVPSKPVGPRVLGCVAPQPLFPTSTKAAMAVGKPAVAASKPAAAAAAAVVVGPKRVKLAGSSTGGRKFSGITEGSVHDRRVSFGSSVLNPFVVGGDDFDSDLQERLDRKAIVSAARTKRLEAKSSAAARLNRVLAVPRTPGDDRSDKDFVPQSSDLEDEEEDSDNDGGGVAAVARRRGGSDGRRGMRVPGSLGVRGLVEQRRQQQAAMDDDVKENAQALGTRPNSRAQQKQSRASVENPVAETTLEQFSDICQASALQMINSADVKKIMKLQGIGKRRAEQIQASVQDEGPIVHVCELQTRLHFKSKLILAILSTFA
ncbi:hypothetical protein IWW37_004457 [Coemansia sp. RSA 2050]|nr:hypothetical protein IWW37_004457 [Coemansia sp. RSA 2050]KAJ2731322.1 hypothetical protein IW152_004627 [Coemansia sp. BCRC 34962]